MLDLTFTASDYKNMKFNPESLGKKQIPFVVWGEQLDFPEIKRPFDPEYEKKKDKFLLFCLYMYDRESPFVKHYTEDIQLRRYHCALKAGFDTDHNGQFSKVIEDMITGKHQSSAAMAVRMMRLLGGSRWTIFSVLTEKVYDDLIKFRYSNDTSFTSISSTIKERDRAELELRQYDNSKDIIEELYRHQEQESLKLRPEEIAKRLELNEEDEWPGK